MVVNAPGHKGIEHQRLCGVREQGPERPMHTQVVAPHHQPQQSRPLPSLSRCRLLRRPQAWEPRADALVQPRPPRLVLGQRHHEPRGIHLLVLVVFVVIIAAVRATQRRLGPRLQRRQRVQVLGAQERLQGKGFRWGWVRRGGRHGRWWRVLLLLLLLIVLLWGRQQRGRAGDVGDAAWICVMDCPFLSEPRQSAPNTVCIFDRLGRTLGVDLPHLEVPRLALDEAMEAEETCRSACRGAAEELGRPRDRGLVLVLPGAGGRRVWQPIVAGHVGTLLLLRGGFGCGDVRLPSARMGQGHGCMDTPPSLASSACPLFVVTNGPTAQTPAMVRSQNNLHAPIDDGEPTCPRGRARVDGVPHIEIGLLRVWWGGWCKPSSASRLSAIHEKHTTTSHTRLDHIIIRHLILLCLTSPIQHTRRLQAQPTRALRSNHQLLRRGEKGKQGCLVRTAVRSAWARRAFILNRSS